LKKYLNNLWVESVSLMIQAGGSFSKYVRLVREQKGAVGIQSIIMIFIGIVIVYQLIPQLGTDNTLVQASSNSSTMAKFAAGLGEWMFPLLGIIALVFLLFKGRKGKEGV